MFVLTVSLLTATPASAIIGGQPDGNGHPYVGALDVPTSGSAKAGFGSFP